MADIVPVLDADLAQGQCTVWCGAFQLAWQQLGGILNGPVHLANETLVARSLRESTFPERALLPEAWYAAAGFARDGIVERIRDELRERFPDAVVPVLALNRPDDIVVFAYIALAMKFEIPYEKNPIDLVFNDSLGNASAVQSFGCSVEERSAALHGQARVLFDSGPVGSRPNREFALDPCATSEPYQIVLARIETPRSLAEAISKCEHAIRRARACSPLPPFSVFCVPTMDWKISGGFDALEQRRLLNPGFEEYWIQCARQMIRFKLDERGVEVQSSAWLQLIRGMPIVYLFDSPFLIYMKRRGWEHPFLAIWVDSSDLLQQR